MANRERSALTWSVQLQDLCDFLQFSNVLSKKTCEAVQTEQLCLGRLLGSWFCSIRMNRLGVPPTPDVQEDDDDEVDN